MYRAAARYFPPRVARQACGGRRSYAYQRSRLVGATPEPSVSAEKVRHEDQLVSGHRPDALTRLLDAGRTLREP
jgi:hypothetical protein